MHVGQRVQLTKQMTALGSTARPGDQGTVKGAGRKGDHLIVKMDNGRTHFPRQDEVIIASGSH